MNMTRLFFCVFVLLSSGLACKLRRNDGKISSVSDEALPKCEDASPDLLENANGKGIAIQLVGNVNCTEINGKKVLGRIQRAKLTLAEQQNLARVQAQIGDAYNRAVKNGEIHEGYKWISNWWQGVNEICQATVGASPGADSGYKCIDKQGAIIGSLLHKCVKEKFCLPRGFKIVEVDYNVGSLGEHHFIAVFLERDNGVYYLGNVDPWGNANSPEIRYSSYDLSDKNQAALYQCGPNRVPNCSE